MDEETISGADGDDVAREEETGTPQPEPRAVGHSLPHRAAADRDLEPALGREQPKGLVDDGNGRRLGGVGRAQGPPIPGDVEVGESIVRNRSRSPGNEGRRPGSSPRVSATPGQ